MRFRISNGMIFRPWRLKAVIAGLVLFVLFLILMLIPKTALAADDSGTATIAPSPVPASSPGDVAPASTDSDIIATTDDTIVTAGVDDDPIITSTPTDAVAPASTDASPVPSSANSDSVITSAETGGLWADGSTWVGGVAPVAADSAIIATTGSNTVILGAATSIVDLTINSGTLDAGSNTMTVAGNWKNISGTFIPEQGTVVFNDASKTSHIYGNNTFYNLTCLTPGKTLVFEANTLTTIQNTLTIEGGNDNYMTLESSIATIGNMFEIYINSVSDAEGNPYLQYINVYYSHAYGPLVPIPAKNEYIPAELNIGWDATYTATKTGNWSDTTVWGGGPPGSGDAVIIPSGYTVTVDGIDACTSLTINAAGVANGITISGSNSLTVSGAITMNAPTAAVNDTIAVGTGTLSAGSVSITGGGTASWNSILSVSTGTINVTGNIAFAGTAAQAQLTFSGAGTLNLGGTFGTGGTFAASTGTVNCNGSSAQTVAGYTYNVLKSNNTAGVTPVAALTITTLTIADVTAGSVFNDGAYTVTTATTLNLNSGTYNCTAATFPWGTLNAGTGTVNYSLGGVQTVKATTYVNLKLSGSGVKTTTSVTVNGILSMEGTATVSAVPTYGSAATLQYNKPASFTAGVEWPATFSGSGGVKFIGAGVITTAAALTLAAGVPLTINTGATLATGTTSTWTLTVGGTTTVYGTLTLANTGAKTFTGDVTINSGGVWNETGVAAIGFGGSLTNNATTFTANTGTHTFSGATKIISGSTTTSIPTATFTGAYTNSGTLTVATLLTVTTVTLTNNGTITATTALSGTGGVTQGASSTLNIGGTSGITGLDASTNANTVNYTGAGQTVKAVAYKTLGLSGSGAVTMTGVTTIGTDFNMSGSVTATPVITTVGGNVSITSTAVMTTGANDVVTGTLTVGTGAKLIMGGFSLSIGGTSSITGTVNTVTAATGTKTFTGDVTINSGGVWDLSTTNPATSFAGNITMSGTTFNNGTGAAAFSASKSLLGAVVMTFGGSVTPAATFTLTNSNSATVTISSIVLTGNFTQGLNTPTLALTAAAPFSGAGTFNASTNANTVTYTGASAAVKAVTYSSLTVNGTGTATIGGTTVVNGTMTVSSATTNNSTLTVSTALSGAGTLTQGASSTLNIGGTSGITGLDASTNANTVNYTGAAQTVKAVAYKTLGLSGSGAKTLQAGTTTISGNLTLSGTATTTGVVGLTIGGTVTLGSGTAFTAGAFTHNVAGNWTNNGGTFTNTGSTINFNGTTQTIGGSATTTFNNVSTSGSTNTSTGIATNIAGTLSIGDGTTFTAAGFALTVTGTTTIGTGTSGNLTISSATGAKTFTGLVTINAGGTWNNSGNSPITFRGGITFSGTTFTAGSGVQTFDTNSQALTGTFSIPSITVTGVTLTNNNTLTVNTALSGSGELAQGNNAILNLGGTSGITTLTATASGNTVNYTSNTAGQTIKGTTYVNLTINKTGQIGTLGGSTLVNGNLTITAGTLDVDNINNYPLTVKGDWTNNGIFLAQQGTVTFSGAGAQTINGDNTWYGLAVTAAAARTVQFESSKTQTIAANGSLTLTGTPGQLLTLAPKTAATPWNLTVDPTAAQTVSYVNVSYSDASGGAGINASDGTNVDGGNNTNWNFPVAPPPPPPPPPPQPPEVPTPPPPPPSEEITPVFYPTPTPTPTPAPGPVVSPTTFIESIVTFFEEAGGFIAEKATLAYNYALTAINNGLDVSKTFLLDTAQTISSGINTSRIILVGIGENIGSNIDTTRTFLVDAAQTIASGISQPFNQGRDFLARLQLGVAKFYEIVFVKEPIHISNVSQNISAQEVTITWDTNHLSTSQINYGSAIGVYEQTIFVKDQTRAHSVILKDLKPGTTYYYELISKNRDYAIDAPRAFTTSK